MQLSTRSRYAVMAMVDLAMRQTVGCECGPICLAEIAARQRLSQPYLEQLFAKLRRAGLVASARGPGGGYRLARTSDAIAIADIVSAVDEPIRATRCEQGSAGCLEGVGAEGPGRCQTHDLWAELGRQIRAAFVASPGNTLLSADYSQIELRILADFSKDPVLVEAFRNGQDIHARTAEEVFRVGPMAQNAEHRRAAKAINFGIIYGQTPFGLAAQLSIDQKEAAQFIAAYFARYRGVKEYLERSLAEARKSGVTRTMFGRIRPVPEITSTQFNLRNFAERTALNTPLQGTAADLIKLAMIVIAHQLTEQKFKAKMILQVHDELLFEAPHDELDRLRPLVRKAMEQVHELAVPLVVDLKAGPNWRDMK